MFGRSLKKRVAAGDRQIIGCEARASKTVGRVEKVQSGGTRPPSFPGFSKLADSQIGLFQLWRSVKYEEVYLKDYQSGWEAEDNLTAYFRFYYHERIHQALGYRTPAEVYAERN